MIVQIIYKFITPLSVNGGEPPGLKFNPVVLSNLAIAIFHCLSVGITLADEV